ncbi:hypothetical protein [Nocardioides convexus]|uniref:hypothetical protein n=1 Tax=Nocardioides convexus TaxID=2712224 RepID=UPI00241865A5|nr:hypothetical protein [Nocardioides convexus]
MSRPRVVVAGLGDSGLLTAIRLARADVEVVGVSSKPGLVSGQETGLRLARPDDWSRDYRIGFDRFRRLDAARVVHAEPDRSGPPGAQDRHHHARSSGHPLRRPGDRHRRQQRLLAPSGLPDRRGCLDRARERPRAARRGGLRAGRRRGCGGGEHRPAGRDPVARPGRDAGVPG